ncbi:MAG: large conductance mechanosensitive channel protein MscL [Eggerthellaceae bacterium]|nr:large conductance mechanosensitive channel protein MscL [Eggerthellaceae bacterium]
MADEEKKTLIEEFKEFIDKGNAMDMAVGVVIGGAFTAIVTALTTDIINPLITLLSGGAVGEDGVAIPLTVAGFNIGSIISAIINFLIISLVVFLMIKSFNSMKNVGKSLVKKDEEEGEAEPEMNPPACPFCLEEVKEGATRCPHCAGSFAEPAKPTPVEAE